VRYCEVAARAGVALGRQQQHDFLFLAVDDESKDSSPWLAQAERRTCEIGPRTERKAGQLLAKLPKADAY